MPKIEEITYKTHPSEFIDYSAIKELLDGLKAGIGKIEDCILATLNTEINEGGLDLYSANINGVPIYHNKAVEIQQELSSISTECEKIISDIDKAAKEHRQQEIDELIEKLKEEIQKKYDRIAELEGLIAEAEEKRAYYAGLQSEAEKGSTEYNNATNMALSYVNSKAQYNKEIQSLKDELDGGWLCAHNGGLEADLKDALRLTIE